MKFTIYVHQGKEESYANFKEACEEQGIDFESLPEKIQNDAMYIGYEIKLEIDFDLETGESKILSAE